MPIIPWSKAHEELDAFRRAPSLEGAKRTSAALKGLEKLAALPGVRKRIEEISKDFKHARNDGFDGAVGRRDFELASGLLAEFPDGGRVDEDALRVAELAEVTGRPIPSVAGISIARLKWEDRTSFFRMLHAEYSAAGLEAEATAVLRDWTAHDPGDFTPRYAVFRSALATHDYDLARRLAVEFPTSLSVRLIETVSMDESVPIHARAHYLLLCGENAGAAAAFDRIVAQDPADLWALNGRAGIAESSGDVETAKSCYLRILEHEPGRAEIHRRLAEIAMIAKDRGEALARFRAAWDAGDVDAGLRLAEELQSENAEEALATARAISPGELAVDQRFALAGIFLECRANSEAASVLRSIVSLDRRETERVIGVAHDRVEKREGDSMPLLDLLIEIAPYRGYSAEVYQLMAAQALAARERNDEAKEYLKLIQTPEMKWKAEIELIKIALTENPMFRELHAKRLEASLGEAELAGRKIWSEIAYSIGLLWESVENRERAVAMYEMVLSREFQYRDARERVQRLASGPARV